MHFLFHIRKRIVESCKSCVSLLTYFIINYYCSNHNKPVTLHLTWPNVPPMWKLRPVLVDIDVLMRAIKEKMI